jgi:hypothetical protein
MDASKNQQDMKKLDDSWNAQDLETFRRYHSKDCIVRWPNRPPTPRLRSPRTGGDCIRQNVSRPTPREQSLQDHARARRMDTQDCEFAALSATFMPSLLVGTVLVIIGSFFDRRRLPTAHRAQGGKTEGSVILGL